MSSIDVKERAIGAVKWTALTELVPRFVQPLSIIVLARLLSPTDFGVVAIATIVIGFAQIFWDAGMGQALIQTDQNIRDTANVTFWTNLGLGVAAYLIIFVSAPIISRTYDDELIVPVLRVLGLQVIIQAFAAVQSTLYRRNFNFRIVFYVRLATSIIPATVSIPLAYLGAGVWALVGGTILGTLLQSAILWIASTWRPTMTYDWSVAARVGQFGFWIILTGLLAWFYTSADSMLIGAYLGTTALGLYRTGTMIVGLIFGTLLSPMCAILFSLFSRLKNDPVQFKKSFTKVARLIIATALPLSVGMFLLGDQIADVVFGNKWVGLGRVISFMALVEGWSWFATGANYTAYTAMGRPDIWPKVMAFGLLYYLPIYLFAAPKGIEVFLWARLAIVLVATPIHVCLLTRLLGLSPLFLWAQSRASWIAVAVMGIVIFGVQSMVGPHHSYWFENAAILGLLIAFGAVIYITVLAIIDRAFLREAKTMILKAVSR